MGKETLSRYVRGGLVAMIPVTESSLTQAADTILHLQSLIDAEWQTEEGIAAQTCSLNSMPSVAPRLCSLFRMMADVEGWLYVALSRGETRLPVPVPVTGTI